ncbi:hypothetical protein TIFTF001_041434 [Ficus carica]|uniref:Protein kinase domain-containing protein n=1 Tax=Ficus carica TaxID=3494 RepID=A0AA87ZCC8_FICCA|nr:hypothetical protein TIFTF001_041434 [Ficus carica]
MLGPRGTIGYIAPEVASRSFGGILHKSDVYSYGMMILEMTNPSSGPAMSKVIEMLEGSLDSLQVPPKPFLYSPPRSPPANLSSTFE